MKGSAMSTARQTIPDCEIRIATGLFSRVIILRMNNNVLSTVSDGKYQGWSPRLVRRAFKREIFDAEDMGRWSAIVEGTHTAPIELDEDLQRSYDLLLEKHAQLKLWRIDFKERWYFKQPPIWSKIRLSLIRPASRSPHGERRPAERFTIYRAPIGRISREALA